MGRLVQSLAGLMVVGVTLRLASSPAAPKDAFASKDQAHWVAVEKVAPAPDSDELLPTTRLRLSGRQGGKGLVLCEGLETLCGTFIDWLDDSHVRLRLPGDRAEGLRVKDGAQWQGITLAVIVHEDQVMMRRWSEDLQRCLVVIQNCESEDWNLYLRRPGEPTYNAAMRTGWDDPDLFGGCPFSQPPLKLEWAGPRKAVITVPGKRYGLTLREKVGDVSVKWAFAEKKRPKERPFKTLAPLK